MRSRLRTISVIAAREFVTRGRSKAFRVSSGLLLLGLILGIVLPTALTKSTNRFTVALVSASTALPNAISMQAASAAITVTSRVTGNRAAAAAQVQADNAHRRRRRNPGGDLEERREHSAGPGPGRGDDPGHRRPAGPGARDHSR